MEENDLLSFSNNIKCNAVLDRKSMQLEIVMLIVVCCITP
jgi:hypothetical protein